MEDIPLFTTATEFGELELFDSLNFSGESELQPNYDVFNLEDAKSSFSNLSPEELLQEFDFEDGTSFLDSDWMTEKLDFNSTEPVLGNEMETLQFSSFDSSLLVESPSLMGVDSVDLTSVPIEPPTENEAAEITVLEASEPQSESNIFAGVEEILKKLCADRKIPYSEVIASGPPSPLQNVPEVIAPSPAGVSSPGSDLCCDDLELPLVDSPGECVSCPPSSDSQSTPFKTNIQVVKTQQKETLFSPYPKEKPARVRSPQQKKRKREQNKDAATRYRVKKREEQESIQTELCGLEKENVELKDKVASISKEIEYLKNLMLEVCKNKLKKQAMMALRVK